MLMHQPIECEDHTLAGVGPLAGLSFGVKDLFDVAGYPTGGGQPFVLAMSGIKTKTSPVVQQLLDAGARFVGKTVTDEQFAAATVYSERFKKHLADLLGTDGVLVLPTVADIAPLTTDGGEKMESYRNRSIQMLCLAGLSGFPQISMPLGQRLGAPLDLYACANSRTPASIRLLGMAA
jgi:Asp-tRNA(Asn)/Glu-tRNA(Gln) amidotransferase A subunit family amidase